MKIGAIGFELWLFINFEKKKGSGEGGGGGGVGPRNINDILNSSNKEKVSVMVLKRKC